MLSEGQVNEFAERGFVVVPQVVRGDVLAQAARRIDEVVAADPPAADKRGSHFYFRQARDEAALIAPLTDSPAFGLAEELAGAGRLQVPWQVQIALNIPPYSHRPGGPHIDAANPEPTGGPVSGTFTLLAGILMTDQLTENSGNLWAWPGTHLTHAAYFREHGPELFCAYPPIGLPEPEQVKGRAGDLLLAHYLLGHNIGGNYESAQTRRALYFRISAVDHASHRSEFLQDPWHDYAPIRPRGVRGEDLVSGLASDRRDSRQ
ncbi:MAG TPA: phytanoyl-CoA dioxygenase family protein [Trebonia sp.]|nr:phytanoyl-CoA dioxygenase family protein [Trebonia sp.]